MMEIAHAWRVPGGVQLADSEKRKTFDGHLVIGRLTDGRWILSIEPPDRRSVELIITAEQASEVTALLTCPTCALIAEGKTPGCLRHR